MGDDEAARKARIEKYDRGAGSYSAGFVDPAATARRQVSMLSTWGAPLSSGARVLELGCADGMITETLVRSGFEVTAVDFSSAMIDRARERLRDAGLDADLRVADVSAFEPEETYDAVLGLMRTFFAYVEDPVRVLTTLAARTRTKLLVDVNPRTQSLSGARRAVREAGFGSVDWRPFFVPAYRRVNPVGLAALRAAERVPGVRDAILRRKFNAVVKGER
jgi:SAM-dependent methyltransferase